jgi:hypothetical protein
MATATLPQGTRRQVQRRERRQRIPQADLGALRRAAVLLGAGEVVFLVSGFFHPDHVHANDHHAAFAEYAAANRWTLVHIGQFVGMTVMLIGIVTLLDAMSDGHQTRPWRAHYARAAALVSIALYGVLQAVDGVALKQAVDAWAQAPLDEQAAAFRTAEAIRWLEWGVRAFEQFTHGACLVLVAMGILSTRRLPRMIGLFAGLAGLNLIVQGLALSHEGFSMRGGTAGLLALIFNLAWIASLVVAIGTSRSQSATAAI